MDLKTIYGMSLIELIVVIAIIAILAAISLPIYNDYLTKARRNEGLIALLETNNKLEHYFVQHHTYVGANKKSNFVDQNIHHFYKINLSNLGPTTFTVTAVPQGSQATNDIICGALSINQAGQKSISGTGSIEQCWR